ncbi:hypothetical protein PV08_09744 [Exophiala spinifera]|uniref:Uncharacterized protein n=1 Tax=Exophiala spinifera TaxID=91928 RepID=A0A0D1ZHU1_9EURO|nr:uncharacterized protein PV08_09744 [Exophiala spinifera]KIW12467.1 hypothetical protein PV08_09744 [Exophiala spinifera]
MGEEVKSINFNLRRQARETRSRPWLTGSKLRGRSSSGLNGSKDAPKLPESTTAAIVTDQPPSQTGKCDQEGLWAGRTIKEQAKAVLSKASAAVSKIPRWVGLRGGVSRPCKPQPLAGEGVLGKDKPIAMSPTVAGETTTKSRLPVRVKKFVAMRRSVSVQMRRSKAPDANGGKHEDKVVGKKTSLDQKSGEAKGPAKRTQGSMKPKPLKLRVVLPGRSILKHRADLPGETEQVQPAEEGVPSQPKRKVHFSYPDGEPMDDTVKPQPSAEFSVPDDRHWKKYRQWSANRCCRQVMCVCSGNRVYPPDGEDWRFEQDQRGYDYLALSGGIFGGELHFISKLDGMALK